MTKLSKIKNSDFSNGNLDGWNDWRCLRAEICDEPLNGEFALVLGPETGRCSQDVSIRPNSRYRVSACVKTENGAEEAQLVVRGYGGAPISVSSALTEYTEISLEFVSSYTVNTISVQLRHPSGSGRAFVDHVSIICLGDAPPPVLQEFCTPPTRKIQEENGASQQPDEMMQWFFDSKFGMFIHWGVYAAMDEGSEWVMHGEAMTPEVYRKRAENPETGFTASDFNPSQWAELAKDAGMKYMALTTRHHDGYALFESRHPNSWTSVKHLGRDLIREYTEAVRRAGLHVGMYYSPMSWRYPGYYDIFGNNCKPNVWGYTDDPEHKENARLMKEEVYEQVTRLLTDYGPIDYMFWDGGWLGQSVEPETERLFWDPGMYQNPDNQWPVSEEYVEYEEGSDRSLGIMGLVRKHQPQLIVNERFGWIGDITAEEGCFATAGPIRDGQCKEKCLTLQKGGWGYRPDRPVHSFEEVAVFLSDCVVRNINLLLNVAPDRHGVIPENQQQVLRQTGKWLKKVGRSVYNTQGGPWQPLFGEYGFTCNDRSVFCHIYKGYREIETKTFTTQSIGDKQVLKVTDCYTGRKLQWKKNRDNTVTISDVDYSTNPMVTILEIELNSPIY